MQIDKVEVLSAKSPKLLAEQINKLLDEGWGLGGTLQVAVGISKGGNPYEIYSHVMVHLVANPMGGTVEIPLDVKEAIADSMNNAGKKKK